MRANIAIYTVVIANGAIEQMVSAMECIMVRGS